MRQHKPYVRQRTAAEIRSFFRGRGALMKGDVVIYKIKPHGSKRYVTSYRAKVTKR